MCIRDSFRTILSEDLLHRVLESRGYRVTHVRNLTDVEDRIIKKAHDQGVTIDEFTDKYIKAFFEDLETLRVRPAASYPRATQHIPEMVQLIQRLAAGGHTYEVEGSHYFRIGSFPDYGKLAHLDLKGLKPGARVDVDEYGKDDPRDFALWKARKPEEHFWDTPLGPGRPGWHIECSAMSMRYLGESFDIHTGGIDLIFPHHEDEIAQSEAATGKPFVRFWLHTAHLQDETGEKMSKRLKNFATVRDLVEAGYAPRVIRYALLTGAHYRSPLAFSTDLLTQAESAVKRLDEFAVRLASALSPLPLGESQGTTSSPLPLGEGQGRGPAASAEPPAQIREQWDAALSEDLNLPAAVGHLFEWVRAFNTRLESGQTSPAERAAAMAMLRYANDVLDVIQFPEAAPDGEVQRLIDERQVAREAGNFARSDEIRDVLRQRGIQLEDTKELSLIHI